MTLSQFWNEIKFFIEQYKNYFNPYTLVIIFLFVMLVLQNHRNKDLNKKIDTITDKILFMRDDSYQNTVNAIDPLLKYISKFKEKIDTVDEQRKEEKYSLNNSMDNIADLQRQLQHETSKLKEETAKFINMFKRPSYSGRWGEMQLKKIAEISGMLPFCEFEMQANFTNKRPDMILKLPNKGLLFVDSKVPIDYYLKVFDGTEESVQAISKVVRSHITSLSKKQYWDQEISPQLVVMFIPIEKIWLDAMEGDSFLLQYAMEKNVMVATPMTLLGMFKSIFVGWEQVYLAREAEDVKRHVKNYAKIIGETLGSLNDFVKQQRQISENLHINIQKLSDVQTAVDRLIIPRLIETEIKS
jgi:DNA anti-recombination protein RmuC